MIFGYCRVSTNGQVPGTSLKDQEDKIKGIYPEAKIVVDAASGVKSREQLNKIITEVQAGDMLVCAKLDRFCRTVKEGLEYIDALQNKGASIHILNMGKIENSAMGKLLVSQLLVFAEFEHAQIVERTQAGKAIAKQDPSFREGRPKKYNAEQIAHAMELLQSNSYKKVSKITGISVRTLARKRGSLCL